MCRNIKTLFNFEPPATEAEIRDASLQFVRKLSGFNAPSKTNQAAFDPANHTEHRGARVDLEGARFVEQYAGFRATLRDALAP